MPARMHIFQWMQKIMYVFTTIFVADFFIVPFFGYLYAKMSPVDAAFDAMCIK